MALVTAMLLRPSVRTFHVPLPDNLHDGLRREAAADDRPATEIVREALAAWLVERERLRLAEAIERYAAAEAGSAYDVDPDLEAASVEHLFAADSQ